MDNIILSMGAHQTREQGVCVMEAVAWFANEKHSDAPHCACPVIASFARRLNDRLDSEERQRLKEYIPALALSRAEWPITLKRALIAADYAVRVFAPVALDARGREKDAARLRALEEITDHATARKGCADAYAAYADAYADAYVAAAAAAAAAAADAAYADAAAAAAADADAAYAAAYAAAAAAAAAADAAYAAAADAAYAAADDAADDAAAAASCRLADLGIECLEKMLAVKE
jgi:hypothetical protein